MARSDHQTVPQYLAAQPPAVRKALKIIRATVRKALPDATEGISYQIPLYKLDGKMVLYFAGYARHLAIYPATPELLRELKTELAGRLHAKATIRFPLDEPVPVRLIARIAKLRAAEVRRTTRARK